MSIQSGTGRSAPALRRNSQLAHKPFFNGPNADLLALIPFLVLCVLLYFVGRNLSPSQNARGRDSAGLTQSALGNRFRVSSRDPQF
ncbi:MAG: hypothetical protein DME60_02550 [Verrucomicrobia bacterium]|nr:MAG: hypothetical protein DME60_02550 [Verrucomicrobiota bacterium]